VKMQHHVILVPSFVFQKVILFCRTLYKGILLPWCKYVLMDDFCCQSLHGKRFVIYETLYSVLLLQ